MEEEKSITIKKSDLWKYSTFLLVAVVLIGGFFMFSGNSTTTGNTVQQPTDQEPTTASAKVDDDAVLGDPNAPITIIEFSDYQCPFCRKFWTETFLQLEKDYVDTGKVKVIFRDFPLSSIHPMAQASGEAAECVREKGGDEAYFKMHDKMFSEQNILDSGNPLGAVTKTATYTNDDLKNWAKDLGYDIGSCLDSGKYKNEILKDTADAQSAGGQGTPFFVIMKSGDSEGTPLSGAYPYDTFKQIIDSLA
ncbi:MAG: DsbA family protein [Nanoarchaeota archaeon]